jgi:hypothetical protein
MEEQVENYDSPSVSWTAGIIQFRLLGIFPLLFFLLQALHYWRIHELGNMLWMCNIGNLLLAIGIFLVNPTLIRIATLWIIPGLAVWIIYVVLAWGVFFSSTLAHVGGLVFALIALRRVGMDRLAWIYAVLWYFVVQLLSRWFTSARLNVNLAHAIDEGWRRSFSSYWKFWCVLTAVVGVGLWLLGMLLSVIFPVGKQTNKTAVTVRTSTKQ